MKKTVLIPLPARDFDPTEVAVPWKMLTESGIDVVFSTPRGKPGAGDEVLLTGRGFGPLKHFLMTDRNGLAAYRTMIESHEFKNPMPYANINDHSVDGLLLPGGHAPGVREYIESPEVQQLTKNFFVHNKPVGAICHGVLLAARTKNPLNNQSVLSGKRSTALPAWMENLSYTLTRAWMGTYYKTYPSTVQSEVEEALGNTEFFSAGPYSFSRDRPQDRSAGFVMIDGNYVSARWPGDAHLFAFEFCKLLECTFTNSISTV